MKKIYTSIQFLSLLLFIFLNSFAQNSEKVEAKINIIRTTTSISIYAIAENYSTLAKDNLIFEISSEKKSTNGNLSSSKQIASFSILPSETKVLSKLRFKTEKESNITINLYIKDGTNVLDKESYIISGSDILSRRDLLRDKRIKKPIIEIANNSISK